jgi:hypothetical protein
MVRYVSPKIAAPGFSNHQAGLAIDFWQERTKGNRIANSTDRAAVQKWRATWFFAWLQANAARFQFEEYTREPWHWTYRGKAGITAGSATASPPAPGAAPGTTPAEPGTPTRIGVAAGDKLENWAERAIERNAEWSRRLGWAERVDEIVAHFQTLGYLPPLQTPNEEGFARAVKMYQGQHPPLVDDGVLGPRSWRRLEPDISQREGQVSRPVSQGTGIGKARHQIKLAGLNRLERTMAAIHNDYGSYLEQKSNELGIDIADAAAFLKVESGGQGFSRQTGKMIIRFENHKFYDLWGRRNRQQFQEHFRFSSAKRWLGHKFRADTSAEFREVHTSQSREWEVLEFARGLDEEAALQSISMGTAQVLGSNYGMLGYQSAKEMFMDMSGSLEAQTEGLFRYIARRSNGVIVRALQAKNYTLAARYYNGVGKQELYGRKLRAASEAYTRVVRRIASASQ